MLTEASADVQRQTAYVANERANLEKQWDRGDSISTEDLRVALSEGGIGWMPYVIERLDYTWERHRYYTGVDLETRPSDLFRRHIWGCFIDDEAGLTVSGVTVSELKSVFPGF